MAKMSLRTTHKERVAAAEAGGGLAWHGYAAGSWDNDFVYRLAEDAIDLEKLLASQEEEIQRLQEKLRSMDNFAVKYGKYGEYILKLEEEIKRLRVALAEIERYCEQSIWDETAGKYDIGAIKHMAEKAL